MNILKYFSQNKILSRREAEKYIKAGKVKVNGKVIESLVQVDPLKDQVELIGGVEEKTTIIFNKPKGISSSKIESEGKNIFDLLPQFKNLNTIGRLDKESEGLILLSDDGVLARIVTGEDHKIEKEYVVEVYEEVTQSKINALSSRMMLEDGPTLPAQAEILDNHSFSIILKEGRNHQIRRMANKVRLTIAKLRRVRVGSIHIGNLAVGAYRKATNEELQQLKQM